MLFAAILITGCARSNEPATLRAGSRVVVAFDAAHGGGDNGAVSNDGTLVEKQKVWEMCNVLARLATTYNVEVVFTRAADSNLSTAQRISAIAGTTPALLLSLHIRKLNPADNETNEFEAIISPSAAGYTSSKAAAMSILARFAVSGRRTKHTERVVGFIDASTCPAVVLECGNVDNVANMALMADADQTEQLCREILEGVVAYCNNK